MLLLLCVSETRCWCSVAGRGSKKRGKQRSWRRCDARVEAAAHAQQEGGCRNFWVLVWMGGKGAHSLTGATCVLCRASSSVAFRCSERTAVCLFCILENDNAERHPRKPPVKNLGEQTRFARRPADITAVQSNALQRRTANLNFSAICPCTRLCMTNPKKSLTRDLLDRKKQTVQQHRRISSSFYASQRVRLWAFFCQLSPP